MACHFLTWWLHWHHHGGPIRGYCRNRWLGPCLVPRRLPPLRLLPL
jgi:hypothetical protein